MSALRRIHELERSADDELSRRDVRFLLRAFRIMQELASSDWLNRRNIPGSALRERQLLDEFEERMSGKLVGK